MLRYIRIGHEELWSAKKTSETIALLHVYTHERYPNQDFADISFLGAISAILCVYVLIALAVFAGVCYALKLLFLLTLTYVSVYALQLVCMIAESVFVLAIAYMLFACIIGLLVS